MDFLMNWFVIPSLQRVGDYIRNRGPGFELAWQMPAPQWGIFPVPGCLTLCGLTRPLPPPQDCSVGSMCVAPLSGSAQQQPPCKSWETGRSCSEGDMDGGTPGMLRLWETTAGTMWGTGSISQRGLLEEGRFKTMALSHLHLRILASRAGRGQHPVAFRPSPLLMALCDRNTPES